jgi:hypothetical protein
MIRGADLSHADICEISTELEAEENLDPQPPGHVHHHRRGRLRRQLSEAHRHPSPTVLSHQRDWPGRDVGAEQQPPTLAAIAFKPPSPRITIRNGRERPDSRLHDYADAAGLRHKVYTIQVIRIYKEL